MKFANAKHNWKIQKLKKIFFREILEKLARLWHVGMPSSKFSAPLVRWHVKLKYWHDFWHVSTPSWKIDTLARKIRSWHAFGTLARGNVEHAGSYGTRFSKLGVYYPWVLNMAGLQKVINKPYHALEYCLNMFKYAWNRPLKKP